MLVSYLGEWWIEFKDKEISVYFGSKYYGDYVVLQEPYCLKCAFPNVTTEDCGWHWDDYGFERIYAMGAYLSPKTDEGYSDLLSKHIRGLKRYPAYSVPLGLALAECVKNMHKELLDMDLIVPMPLFETELKVSKKGVEYNQAVELTKVLSNEVGIHYIEAVAKTREKRMKGLTREERKEAVKGLYKVTKANQVKGKQILLVDDVSTSGATASECSKTLIDAGATTVNVLVAGRATGIY